MAEDKEAVIMKIKSSLQKKHPTWDDDKVKETAIKIYNSRNKAKENTRRKELDIKDKETRVFGFIRSTYPDLEGEVSPKETLDAWANQINEYPDMNNFSAMGDYHHDRTDKHLVSVAEYAEVIPIDNNNYGLWVSDFVNEVHPDFNVIKEELGNGMLPAYSVEFDSRGMQGNVITPDCKLWGYAHASRPVDTHAVKTRDKEERHKVIDIIYKEDKEGNMENKEEVVIVQTNTIPAVPTGPNKCLVCGKQYTGDKCMECDKQKLETQGVQMVPETKEVKQEEVKIEVKEEKVVEEIAVKLKEAVADVVPPNKVLIKTKETEDEETMEELPLKLKEMKSAVEKKDWMSFKEAGMNYIKQKEVDEKLSEQFATYGIPLRTTMKMKCVGNKLQITEGPELKFKDILNTGTNPGAYTESPVEFADLFQPGIVDTFNNQTGLLDAIKKVDIIPGGAYYGFTTKIARNASAAFFDPDDVSVTTGFIDKLKLRQEIKVLRIGVSVADYTLYHARASLGDLFALEVQSSMNDLMVAIGTALYTESVGADGTNAFLGLEAVADSAGNTSMYGKTRSAANRLSPDSAALTLTTVGGALSEAALRLGIDNLLQQGSRLEDIRIVTSPKGRSYLFNLLDGTIYYQSQQATARPALGFNRFVAPAYDGIPIVVDPLCSSTLATIGSTTACVYIIDISEESGFVLGMSKPPQLTGLAKVSAATSAYIEMYGTTVYKKPRNIHLLDNVTS